MYSTLIRTRNIFIACNCVHSVWRHTIILSHHCMHAPIVFFMHGCGVTCTYDGVPYVGIVIWCSHYHTIMLVPLPHMHAYMISSTHILIPIYTLCIPCSWPLQLVSGMWCFLTVCKYGLHCYILAATGHDLCVQHNVVRTWSEDKPRKSPLCVCSGVQLVIQALAWHIGRQTQEDTLV